MCNDVVGGERGTVVELTPCRILNVQTSAVELGVQLVASTGVRFRVWPERHRYSPVCPSMSRPPWSGTVTGLIAPVGVIMPALITAPGAPAAEEDVPVFAELGTATAGRENRPEQRYRYADDGAAADEVAAGQPPRGELVDDVVGDLTLALAQVPEPVVIEFLVMGASLGWGGITELDFSQFGERDVTADQVTRLFFEQGGFGGFADAGGQLAWTAGMEYAASWRVGRGRDLTMQPDPVRR